MASTTTVEPGRAAAATGARAQAQRKGIHWGAVRSYVGITLIVLFCLAPFYWMIVTSFRDVGYTFDNTPWPTHVTLDNYRTVFDTSLGNNFARALLNSAIIGVCTTILAVMFGVFAAYALARLDFRGKFVVLGIVLGASMFPGVALLTPLFQLFTNIGWFGTYQALIIPDISFALPLTIYVLTAFFAEMPWELEQAALVDGATPGQAFRKVILPLAAPGLFTTAILAFIASWNEFLLASQLSSDRTQPVTVAIAFFTGSQPHQEPYTAVMAAGTVVTVPLVIDGDEAAQLAERIATEQPDRRAGRPGDAATAELVARELARRGLSAGARSSASASRTRAGRLENVIARRAGGSRRQIVVVAARDASAVPDGPGSASDTAALLELARVFQGRPSRKTLVLASVDGSVAGRGRHRAGRSRAGRSDFVDAVLVVSEPRLGRERAVRAGVVERRAARRHRPAADGRRSRSARSSTRRGGAAGVFGQLARLAFPIGIGPQGVLLAEGYEAVRISGSGELPPPGDGPVEEIDENRLGALGRATLRTVTALDQGRRPAHGPVATCSR